MSSTQHKANVLTGPYVKIWPLVQHLHKIDPAVRTSADIGRAQYLYRNSVLTILYQIKARPLERGLLINSLMDHIKTSKSVSGLESIFLTLLYVARNAGIVPIVDFATFVENSPKAFVPGNGPMLFYNPDDDTLTRLSDAHALAVVKGQFIGNAHTLPQTLGQGALWTLHNVFPGTVPAPAPAPAPAPLPVHPSLHAQAAHVQPTVHAATAAPSAAAAAAQEKDQHRSAAETVVAVIGVGAALMFPPTGTLAALAVAAAAATTLALAVDHLTSAYGLDKKPVDAPQPTSQTEDPAPDEEQGFEGGEGGGEGEGGDEGGEVGGTSPAEGDGTGDGDGDGCFAFDTPVLMSDGSLKAIGTIQLGEFVLAETKTGDQQNCRVTALHTHDAPETLLLKLNASSLVTTPRQRFSMRHSGMFTAAQTLSPGDGLNTRDRKVSSVSSISAAQAQQQVFNLTVENAHTYFVGEECVLVHNRKISGPTQGPGEEGHGGIA